MERGLSRGRWKFLVLGDEQAAGVFGVLGAGGTARAKVQPTTVLSG